MRNGLIYEKGKQVLKNASDHKFVLSFFQSKKLEFVDKEVIFRSGVTSLRVVHISVRGFLQSEKALFLHILQINSKTRRKEEL